MYAICLVIESPRLDVTLTVNVWVLGFILLLAPCEYPNPTNYRHEKRNSDRELPTDTSSTVN
jgi:hypothetical protein